MDQEAEHTSVGDSPSDSPLSPNCSTLTNDNKGDSAAGHTSVGDSPTASPPSPNCPTLTQTPENDNKWDSGQGQLGLLTPLDPGLISATTILPPSQSANHSSNPQQRAKKLRKRTALFKSPKGGSEAAHVITNHKLKDRVKTLEHDLIEVRELLEFYKSTLQSSMLDNYQKVKNEAKIIAKDNHDETTYRCDILEDKVEALENNETRQQQIIQSLKSRISCLEKRNKQLETSGYAYALSNHPNSPTVNHASHDPERPDLTQSGLSDNGPYHARSRSGQHDRDPERPDLPKSGPSDDGPYYARSRSDQHDRDPKRLDLPKSGPSDDGPSHDRSRSDQQVNNDNRTPTPAPLAPSQPSVATPTRSDDSMRHGGREEARRVETGVTPGQVTDTDTVTVTIEPDGETNALLIGDSVIRGINPNKNSTDLKWQTIVTPGCRPKHIRDCLNNKNPNSEILEVTLHVGANNTKQDTISMKEWSETLKSLLFAFPLAHITASAIVPSKGKDQMHQNIQTSNTNLKKTCTRLGITYIEHNQIFQAPSGAPKLALYRDKYHPSRKGTALLAINLFGENVTSMSNRNTQSQTHHTEQNNHHTPPYMRDMSPPSIPNNMQQQTQVDQNSNRTITIDRSQTLLPTAPPSTHPQPHPRPHPHPHPHPQPHPHHFPHPHPHPHPSGYYIPQHPLFHYPQNNTMLRPLPQFISNEPISPFPQYHTHPGFLAY